MIDTHVHITLPEQKVLHHKLSLSEYVSQIERVGGGKGIVFLNPFDDKYCCPNSLKDNRLHKSIVQNISKDTYCIACENCKTVHYKGEDIFRKDNIKLLNLANDYNMYALAFLTAPNLSVQHQVDYYEKNYPGFLGYKIHPTISMFPADKLHICSNKTIVFHCGNDKYASPQQLLEFAKKYSGNVVIAHCARFDKRALREISDMKNVWIDMSPFTFLYELIKRKPQQLCDTWSEIGEKNDIGMLFDAIADCVGLEKILFASDAPFGNLKKEINFLKNLHLREHDVKQIMEENARTAFKL